MTPAIPSSELFRLQGQLFELMAERDESYGRLELARSWRGDFEASPVPQAEAEYNALNEAIGSFLLERIKSVDDIRNPLLAMQAARQMCEAEAQRATNQALKWQRQIDTVLDLVRHCMKHLDEIGTWKPKESRKLQSALGSIMLVNNGGKQPVEITDEALVPDEYKRVTMTMSVLDQELLCEMLNWAADERPGTNEAQGVRDLVSRIMLSIRSKDVSKSAIEAALNQPCESCEGVGRRCVHESQLSEVWDTCDSCGGTGKRGIPGARLAERDQHVRISGLTK